MFIAGLEGHMHLYNYRYSLDSDDFSGLRIYLQELGGKRSTDTLEDDLTIQTNVCICYPQCDHRGTYAHSPV